ncbi:hypothetical protein GGD61_008382 [Bradyrhizobium sp. SBR1B]|nr:hypothetical protein [Bradyrhizobium sp. SBR1B]
MLAQQEQGELEKTQRMQNWARLLPSYSDVTRIVEFVACQSL